MLIEKLFLAVHVAAALSLFGAAVFIATTGAATPGAAAIMGAVGVCVAATTLALREHYSAQAAVRHRRRALVGFPPA